MPLRELAATASWPASCSSFTAFEPIRPVPPMTTTFFIMLMVLLL